MAKPAKNTICVWYDRDAEEAATGAEGFWSFEELAAETPLTAGEKYKRVPPSPPYGSPPADYV